MGGETEGSFDHWAGAFHPHRFSITLLLLGFFIFPFVFGACSSEREGEAEPLEARVRGFWEARTAGDDTKAYGYEAYSKTGKMTLEQYIRARNPALKYKTYEVKKTVENGDQATATVDVQYNLVIPVGAELNLSMSMEEHWVRLEGQWYRDQQPTPLSGPKTG